MSLPGWRSSTLGDFQFCPMAGEHAEQGVPRDRRIFPTGTTVHVGLQTVGEGMVAARKAGTKIPDDGLKDFTDAILHRTAAALMSTGRRFDGGAPETLPYEPVRTGMELAAEYLSTRRLSSLADYEIGLAVDNDMLAVPYDSPDVRLRGILDVASPEDRTDENGEGGTLLAITEYKTAWPTREGWHKSIQAACQRCLAWARALAMPEPYRPAGIVLRVDNLRTGGRYESEVLWLDDTGAQDSIDADWRWLQTLMVAADRKPRVAQPGANCLGCPYAYMCPDAFYVATAPEAFVPSERPAALAKAYAAAVAVVEALKPLVREVVGEESIKVPGGTVGYRSYTKKKAGPGAVDDLWKAWTGGDSDPGEDIMKGLLAALKLGAGNLRNVMKQLYPGRGPNRMDDFMDRREEFAAKVLEDNPGSRFGVWRDKQETQEDEEDN